MVSRLDVVEVLKVDDPKAEGHSNFDLHPIAQDGPAFLPGKSHKTFEKFPHRAISARKWSDSQTDSAGIGQWENMDSQHNMKLEFNNGSLQLEQLLRLELQPSTQHWGHSQQRQCGWEESQLLLHPTSSWLYRQWYFSIPSQQRDHGIASREFWWVVVTYRK